MKTLNILIACEESQAECKEFRLLGHNAYSCDIQKCGRGANPDWHIKNDVSPYLNGCTSFVTQSGDKVQVKQWDLIIAHPPCTYLTKVGSRWMYHAADCWRCIDGVWYEFNSDRYNKMREAKEFFLKCLYANAKYVAVENPIPMGIAQLPRPTTYVCPSWFGSRYTKKTLYWLKNLPPIMPTIVNPNATSLCAHRSGKYRSRTSPLMAKAIAKQWSEYILSQEC